MFREEIYTGRGVRASRMDIAESWDRFQLLSYDNCGHRKSLPCTQIFPNRQAPQTTSENKERNIVAWGVLQGKFQPRIGVKRDQQQLRINMMYVLLSLVIYIFFSFWVNITRRYNHASNFYQSNGIQVLFSYPVLKSHILWRFLNEGNCMNILSRVYGSATNNNGF